MQISKQRLIQIIKEELNTQEPTNEAEDGELEVNEEKEMSRHAYELYKNIKKGYSPQAANTAIPGHEESYKAYWDSLNKKPKRGKKDLEEDGSGYSWGMRPPPKAEPSVDEAAADSGVQQMIYDYIEDNLENGPLSLDDILTLTQPTYDDEYAPLEDIWEEVLEAAIEELELAEEIVRVQDWNDPSSLPRWTI